MPTVTRQPNIAPRSQELPARIRWVSGYFAIGGAVGVAGALIGASALFFDLGVVSTTLHAKPWMPLVALANGAGWIYASRQLADGERRGAIVAIVAMLPAVVQVVTGNGGLDSTAILHAVAVVGLLSVWRRLR
ncbi:hypothetical protein [Gemmatimonas groenlandica]|uniref:Uncharacterized protein n=1 Tax=Gemmatimonas groenlandica TaxID=2732249 RepID=A0A6M4IZI6_9BACT|nr:hypothetical protein [Gemmatimonas groenlandica]QJR37631.1 hypothetical protein HKW67_19960 [Gemmatimonas groenlandica]